MRWRAGLISILVHVTLMLCVAIPHLREGAAPLPRGELSMFDVRVTPSKDEAVVKPPSDNQTVVKQPVSANVANPPTTIVAEAAVAATATRSAAAAPGLLIEATALRPATAIDQLSHLPASASSQEIGRADYATRVAAWLERHKSFPRSLERASADHVVLIRFEVDRRGRVRKVEIAASCGLPWLDRVAVEQVRDASPFPRPPENASAADLSFEVPMRYLSARSL